MIKRPFNYLLLGLLTIVTPYAATMLLIIVTGDRLDGMKLAAIPGLILPHLIFGLVVITGQLHTKLLLTALVTAAAFGGLIVTMRFQLIKTNLDPYGFWDLNATNFIVGLVAWEIFYHVHRHTVNGNPPE